MAKVKPKRAEGLIRQGQLITTFGPGAMMDLPNHSIIVGGLDEWSGVEHEIIEPRLIEKLRELHNIADLKLYSPPAAHDDPTKPATGITAWQFPEWYITQDVVESGSGRNLVRSRKLVHKNSLIKGRFEDEGKKKSVVPIRFVRACKFGHIGDIDWYYFAHGKGGDKGCRRQLWLDELGNSVDLGDVRLRCECGESRPLMDAVGNDVRSLGKCDGARPWLGAYSAEQNCPEMNKLLIRSASNAYFPQKMSVISLPAKDERISQAVTNVWMFLEEVDSASEVQYERKKDRVNKALDGISDEEVWSEIQSRRGISEDNVESVKEAELKTLIGIEEEAGNDVPDGDFYARSLQKDVWDKAWMTGVKKVVLVHRLREVVAQVGFTRFEPAGTDVEKGELDMGVTPAKLADPITWLPAMENRGEGIFIQFDNAAIEVWLKKSEVANYSAVLEGGFAKWKSERNSSSLRFPGLPYIMLHTLSHLLVTAISLECGYSASAIKERVYAIDGLGYGILLYTGSSDAEGTLGGLIQVGKNVQDHVRAALQYGELCSNDPVCAAHDPTNEYERRFLQGAACHGCVLIAETSCEMFNDFLDRNLVVGTLENVGAEFFNLQ